ncbi:hypothetical protein GQ44DRAFT_824256 [Phaeosphaeriaceae sp. PMI808]|nr:hypothetical protein GQ44DRAFT_824256 [Phaeosphaeriaceae sp. PMI808]
MHSPVLLQRDEVVGVVPPPLGITPDFTHPPSRAHVFLTTHIVAGILSTLFIGLRFYTVRFVTRYVRVEDYMLVAAWVFALVYSILGALGIQYGYGRHLWDIPFTMFNPNFMKLGAIGGTFYGISIMLTKLSILTFFIQFAPQRNLRVAIYMTMAFVVMYSLVTSFEWVYACRPIEKYWDLTITSGSCIDWLKITVFSGVMNTTTDAAILILPVLLLRKIQLPKRQKIGVMAILMTGGFILIVSIIKLKLQVDFAKTKDISWEMVLPMVWWTIEVHLAIVCACLPAGKPFLRKHMPKVIGSSYGTSSRTKRTTVRSTHTQRLASTDTGEDPQDIILADNIHRRTSINISTTTVGLATEQVVRTEYGSDKGLIITDSCNLGRDPNFHLRGN